MKDPDFKKEWDALEPDFSIVQALIDARKLRDLLKANWQEKRVLLKAILAGLKTAMEIHR